MSSKFPWVLFVVKSSRIMLLALLLAASSVQADEVIDVWPDLAPGETTRQVGSALPRRPTENPPATRIQQITRPQLHRFSPPAEKRNRGAVLILPGGGYNYVVSDKEGSEAAQWLTGLGWTAFVLHYRTKATPTDPQPWVRPLEDGQRAVSLLRARAAEWELDPQRIGVLGFSAGGQAAALVTTRFEHRQYAAIDAVDQQSCRPDFSLLVYPWQLIDDKTQELKELVTVTKQTPPTFLVHAHDDGASSLSSVLFYAALKKQGVSGELHVYRNGGHGYGLRPVAESQVHTWPDRAAEWLKGLK